MTTGRIAAAYGRLSGIRQVAPVCTPRNTWFLGPIRVGTTRVLNPNGISIGSAVFVGRTSVTDRQITRSVTIGRIAVLRTLMRPKYDIISAARRLHVVALLRNITFDFFTARRFASAVLATAIPSVRPSHAGIVSKRRHVARRSLHCRIAKCI